jgi:hypothetical protein
MHTKTTKTFVMLTNFRNFGYDELTIHTEMKEKGICVFLRRKRCFLTQKTMFSNAGNDVFQITMRFLKAKRCAPQKEIRVFLLHFSRFFVPLHPERLSVNYGQT